MPLDLTLEAPARSWALLGLLALAVVAVVLAVRHRRSEAYADAALRPSVRRGGRDWVRTLSALAFALGVLVLTTGFARPSVKSEVGERHAVVVIALDTSTSMEVDDVKPNRFTAAKETAKAFIRGLPAGIDVGLVGYDASVSLVAAPTSDHEQAAAAVDTLTLKGGTAMGDALQLSLKAALDDLRDSDGTLPSPPPARIVLLSDGGNTTGSPLDDAIAAAADDQVPVSTIALGTESGVGKVFDGRSVTAPVDYTALASVASGTGGKEYHAAGEAQLKAIYADIGSQIVKRLQRHDVSDLFAGAGVALLALAAVPSLLLRGRLL
ncbi:Ca-activated chloride channel family protein [Motilibacter rhizosphaerae]|uniref:Ca-activated chloride channel family protein n=1 Tax=Motilibacter rhizosphaerae TaxID=598652 RepID=A0A4Q7NRG1_9ACTN|nr:VWA domain-containing protein [Motilibacter rhizosphaerae]RZS89656.1 Ca-activated chloride channel family protein [Motilibacter rhizosphaerae]